MPKPIVTKSGLWYEQACGCYTRDPYWYHHAPKGTLCYDRAILEWNWHIRLGQAFKVWCKLYASGGRLMECSYGGNVAPSDSNAAFFEYRPNAPRDTYYCGCFGWD